MDYGEIRCTRCRRITDDWTDAADGAICLRCEADEDRDPDHGGYDRLRDERVDDR